MISKESFLKNLRVLGKQYANKTILDSKDHQDAVVSDYLQGAEDSYDTFRTYDKERFCDSLRNILNYYKKLEGLEDVEKEWIIDGELVKVETPEQFYDALKKLNRV